MGGTTPFSSILSGMMPLIRQKINEVDEKQLQTLCNVMAQAFEKVSDPSITEAEFTEWMNSE